MTHWTAFPFDADSYRCDDAALRKKWPRLHTGDAEPLPADDKVRAAWSLFHAGEFQQAFDAGLQAGGAGITVANKAQATYAFHLEPHANTKLAMFLQVAERAKAQAASHPTNANAHFWKGCALGRYGQCISAAQALALGLGSKVKESLEKAIQLCPQHADAHIALGTFHAEVIDKAGALLGRSQGASKPVGLSMFKTALKLNPGSAIARIEYASGLVKLEGEKARREVIQLYREAAACIPADAMEHLDMELARDELAS